MSLRCALALLTGVLTSGCATDVGVALEDFRPARAPAGVQTELVLQRRLVPGNELVGELLAAGESGLHLLLDRPLDTPQGPRRVVHTPFYLLRVIRLEQVGSFRVRSEGAALDQARIRRLTMLSRFPQGLSGSLLDDLLVAYGETAVFVPSAADDEE